MIVRALDSNGDWTYGNGQGNYLSGNAAVTQCIQTRLSSFVGDCFFDAGAGLPWFLFLAGYKSALEVSLALSAVILNTPAVLSPTNTIQAITGINQLYATLNTAARKFSIAWKAQSVYSLTGTQGQFSYDLPPST